MINVKKALQAYLETLHSQVYFKDAPDDAPYPYLVINFGQTMASGEYTKQIIVDIDFWDFPANNDDTSLENLATLVEGNGNITNPTGLNKKVLTTSNGHINFKLDRVLDLHEKDKRILRKMQIYEAKMFLRGE